MRELEGFYFEQMVDPDPIMEMSRDTESDNGEEVLSQSKPNCIGLRECRISKESNLTQPEMEKNMFTRHNVE